MTMTKCTINVKIWNDIKDIFANVIQNYFNNNDKVPDTYELLLNQHLEEFSKILFNEIQLHLNIKEYEYEDEDKEVKTRVNDLTKHVTQVSEEVDKLREQIPVEILNGINRDFAKHVRFRMKPLKVDIKAVPSVRDMNRIQETTDTIMKTVKTLHTNIKKRNRTATDLLAYIKEGPMLEASTMEQLLQEPANAVSSTTTATTNTKQQQRKKKKRRKSRNT